jgi:branched-chain amino acid transport system permease protein
MSTVSSSIARNDRSQWLSWQRLVVGALVLLGLLLPLQHFIYIVLVMKVMCFALFACSFNLLLGFAGLMSFGHAAFFGTAAYITVYASNTWGVTPEIAVLLGTAVATALGYVIGGLTVRKKGIYFAMITLALAEMVYFLAVQLPQTGGEDGVRMERGRLFGLIDLTNDVTLYYAVFLVFIAAFVFVHRVVSSPFGEIIRSIREHEARAISLGYDTAKFKLTVFVISAGLAGLAGSMKALVLQLASLSDVNWQTSGDVVLMTFLGGVGTVTGPIVGAGLVVSLQHFLASMGSWSSIVSGLVFMGCVLSFKRGLVGGLKQQLLARENRSLGSGDH